MFTWLRSLASADCIFELHSTRFRLRDMSGTIVLEFEPVLAIDGETRVVSIGRPVNPVAVKVFTPFDSPAGVAEHRRIAELLLQYAYSKLSGIAWLKPSPSVVMHIPTDSRNLAQQIDDKTLALLSMTAGARRTVVYRGASLSGAEARRLLSAA
jgi:hypothetical protein